MRSPRGSYWAFTRTGAYQTLLGLAMRRRRRPCEASRRPAGSNRGGLVWSGRRNGANANHSNIDLSPEPRSRAGAGSELQNCSFVAPTGTATPQHLLLQAQVQCTTLTLYQSLWRGSLAASQAEKPPRSDFRSTRFPFDYGYSPLDGSLRRRSSGSDWEPQNLRTDYRR